jgi:hypothetical protein
MDPSLPLGFAAKRLGLDPITAMTRDHGDVGDL